MKNWWKRSPKTETGGPLPRKSSGHEKETAKETEWPKFRKETSLTCQQHFTLLILLFFLRTSSFLSFQAITFSWVSCNTQS